MHAYILCALLLLLITALSQQESELKAFRTDGICGTYKDTNNQRINPREQQDADEFLLVFLDRYTNCNYI
jgi:hypothetical protein